MSRLKLVLIEWVDSQMTEGRTTDEPAADVLVCRSVGWLVHDGKKCKTIAPHISLEDAPQRSGEMTIPACAITRFRVLKEP